MITLRSRKLLAAMFVTLSVAGCTQEEVRDGLDWENISQFKSSSVAGPDFLWVVTENGELIRISNQGATHKVVQPEPVKVVVFSDSMHGFNVDRTGSVRTTGDGGNAWQQVVSPQCGKVSINPISWFSTMRRTVGSLEAIEFCELPMVARVGNSDSLQKEIVMGGWPSSMVERFRMLIRVG